jgi:uncharacterized protein YjbJ (UPF0337 family)
MAVNPQVLKGDWNKIKGKLRDRWGHLSNDELESAHGNIDQLVGTIQRRTGEARESVERYLEELTGSAASAASKASETMREYVDTAGESLRSAKKQAGEAVKAGYSKTEQMVQERPVESLAVCFGAGIVTGVIFGLVLRSR